MKSVLMIAYSFPPEGHAGAYRPLRFIRHLGSMGWRGSVISAGGTQFERYDPKLLADVPCDTEVTRVTSRDLWRSIQWKRSQRSQRKSAATPVDKPVREFTSLASR